MKKNLKITERRTERSIPITCESRHIRTDVLVLSDGDAQPVTEVLFVFRKLNESLAMGDIYAGIMETDVPDADIFPFLMKLGNFLKPVRQTGVEDLYFYYHRCNASHSNDRPWRISLSEHELPGNTGT